MKIILLSGWSQSGKSTVADILAKHYKATVFAFADELKTIVAKEYNIPIEWTMTQKGKENRTSEGITVREALIKRGQEIRETMNDPGYFARLVANKIKKLSENTLVVISDWRLPVEIACLKEELPSKEIYTIRIIKEGQVKSPVANSLTENSLDNEYYDYMLYNSGICMDQLRRYIKSIMSYIL